MHFQDTGPGVSMTSIESFTKFHQTPSISLSFVTTIDLSETQRPPVSSGLNNFQFLYGLYVKPLSSRRLLQWLCYTLCDIRDKNVIAGFISPYFSPLTALTRTRKSLGHHPIVSFISSPSASSGTVETRNLLNSNSRASAHKVPSDCGLRKSVSFTLSGLC